jgi:hypothetical protein
MRSSCTHQTVHGDWAMIVNELILCNKHKGDSAQKKVKGAEPLTCNEPRNHRIKPEAQRGKRNLHGNVPAVKPHKEKRRNYA